MQKFDFYLHTYTPRRTYTITRAISYTQIQRHIHEKDMKTICCIDLTLCTCNRTNTTIKNSFPLYVRVCDDCPLISSDLVSSLSVVTFKPLGNAEREQNMHMLY